MLVPHMFILRKKSIKKKRYQGVLISLFPFLVSYKCLFLSVLIVTQVCITQVCVTQTCVNSYQLIYSCL